ncbi:hypothetical protein GMOD_00010057 [Pyrenophora seminiperda CCB06]|uniref:Uncharacterized protein n=1 Tax=Pyrenophora seminiperda CCB06 TaxID=1302712 RepID=A0A3M7M1P9_9PLEO|nr:hypothetical protein GMOD_00010057 [Pyrenophora seminiperda CCB06]
MYPATCTVRPACSPKTIFIWPVMLRQPITSQSLEVIWGQ